MTSYDSKCLELAAHFYPDASPSELEEIARSIQAHVESFEYWVKQENKDR